MGPITQGRKKSLGTQLNELGTLIANMAGLTVNRMEADTEEEEELEVEEEEIEDEEYFEASSGPAVLLTQQAEEGARSSDRLQSPGRDRFKRLTTKLISVKALNPKMTASVDGESQEIWPVTAAWFLGPKAENEKFLKELLIQAIDSHVEFRKYKYFPLDPEYIMPKMQAHPKYKEAEARLRDQLAVLSERLQNSVPFFNFRSQGHMLWDTTLASNVGYIAALLYNQNNVASMASSVTLQLEREAARELCEMVGYRVIKDESEHTTENPGSWGHLPNGGTVANLEALWAARCLKYNGLVVQMMFRKKFTYGKLLEVRKGFTYRNLAGKAVHLMVATAWDLLNIPIDEAIDLFDNLHRFILQQGVEMEFEELFGMVKEFTMEEAGMWEFFNSHQDQFRKEGIQEAAQWFVPGSRHYSWDKGINILGLGRRNLSKVSVDQFCRINLDKLRNQLEECLQKKIPVIGVTAVFGTTQEGAVDDLEEILEMRSELEEKGLTFYVHVDAAWGGYFASVLRSKEGSQLNAEALNSVRRHSAPKRVLSNSNSEVFHDSMLSGHFLNQLYCLKKANSITLDPHKSGFCPYPAGGLLYRNGNIRKFLAQKAAYVHHGSKNNEEINLFGIDGSKPGAASAGVWLSHKVVGLHEEGYGLLLKQCTFSAGVMYSMWVSLDRPEDPFCVVPAIPLKPEFAVAWDKPRIRREILESENSVLTQNREALNFIRENGPDTLINCLSINFRTWDRDRGCWVMNTSLELQREFVDKLYKRCSHSMERPSMVDRGIQIILNSTAWELDSHGDAYREMKDKLGLDSKDNSKIKMIINTCMSPWFRSHKTFKRLSAILRNELYNAYGAITDPEERLRLVSPCSIDTIPNWTEDGTIFAELESSFSCVNRSYHALAMFIISEEDRDPVLQAAREAQSHLSQLQIMTGQRSPIKYLPMRITTCRPYRVFDLMTGQEEQEEEDKMETDGRPSLATNRSYVSANGERAYNGKLSERLAEYGDKNIKYSEVAMPEIQVEISFLPTHNIRAKMKLKRTIRYHHLTRDFVDEANYPPTQEYLLYSHNKRAYLSHCPNRFPDFQQLIELDEVPEPYKGLDASKDKTVLYQEALSRGVVVYLPQVLTGGAPLLRKGEASVCLDPLKHHNYNAVSWSDQGAFTGDMTAITLKFLERGKRWFDGTNINANYNKADFPELFNEVGERRYPQQEEEELQHSYSLPDGTSFN